MAENRDVFIMCSMFSNYTSHDNELSYINSIDTQGLIHAIKELGIEYRDKYNDGFLDYIHYMTKVQVDLLFKYKPNPLYRNDDGELLLYTRLMGIFNGVYMLQKFLEQDNQFLFLRHRTVMYNKKTRDFEFVFLAQIKDRTDLIQDHNMLQNVTMMIENHQKKYFRLFDLLKHHID